MGAGQRGDALFEPPARADRLVWPWRSIFGDFLADAGSITMAVDISVCMGWPQPRAFVTATPWSRTTASGRRLAGASKQC